ncbi:MAG TPA: hypothetical protein VFZ64_04090 [Nocardioidaceae bacterium]
MRARPERVTASAGAAALVLGAVGMAFERAGPSLASAPAEELTSWAAAHHRELTAQSAAYLVGTAPQLVFFAGLRRCLRSSARPGPSAAALGAAVVGGGAAWVLTNAAGQALQVSMARAASSGSPPTVVAGRAATMRRVLTRGNAALAPALAATAVTSLRDGALPTWLGWLSAGTAVAHVAPLATGRRDGGVVEVVPYPLLVAWMVGVTVVLGRRARAVTG